MKDAPIPSAETNLYRVSYVDAIVREVYVEARDENEALDLIGTEIGDCVHHHAIDTFQEDMQVTPAATRSPCHCFECGV